MSATIAGVLAGQRALMTGANSSIGAAVAKRLTGAKVVINYVVNPEAAEQVVKEIETAGGTAIAIQVDVSKEDQVQAMFRQIIDAFGSIDMLVTNAGLQKAALWLASGDSDYVTDATLYVDGSMVLYPGFGTGG